MSFGSLANGSHTSSMVNSGKSKSKVLSRQNTNGHHKPQSFMQESVQQMHSFSHVHSELASVQVCASTKMQTQLQPVLQLDYQAGALLSTCLFQHTATCFMSKSKGRQVEAQPF